MKKILKLMVVAGVLIGLGGTILSAVDVNAVNVFDSCAGNNTSAVCKATSTDNASNMIQIVINTLLFVLGIIAVIMIVIGGIRYTTSGGDPSGLKTARDTIIYSVVGLVVAIMAYAIVNFVVGRFITG